MLSRVRSKEIQTEIGYYCRSPWEFVDNDTGEVFLMPCRSATCPCEVCRIEHARKESMILQRSTKDQEIDFYGVIKFLDRPYLDPDTWSLWRTRIMDTLRKRKRREKWSESGLYLDIRFVIEFTEGGNDINLLIRTNLSQEASEIHQYIRPLIVSASERAEVDFYVRPPKSDIAVVKYVTKDKRDREGVACPPEEWRGKPLHTGHSAFFTHTKEALWEQIKDEARQGNEHSISRRKRTSD